MVCGILVCRADSTSLILSELIVVATSFRAKCRDFILPVHLDTSTRPPFLWISSAWLNHLMWLANTFCYSAFYWQYRLAHVYVSSIVGSFVTPHSGCRWWVFGFTFCEIFFYYNAICKPPHWVAFHPQTAVSANTDAVSEKIQGLYKLVPEKNDCYTFEFNFRHSTSKRDETIFIHESHNKREDFTSIRFANTLCPKSLPNV